MEYETRIEWIFGWAGERDSRRMCGVQHWVGDPGIDFVAVDALRLHGIAAKFWIGAANWRDGAFLEHG